MPKKTGPGLVDRLMQQPRPWQFAQAIRVLLRTVNQQPVQLILASDPSYQAPGAELTGVYPYAAGWKLTISIPCLTGSEGVLPYSYQDEAHQQRMVDENPALQDFFELFNQRILFNSYRVATRYRLACRYELRKLQGRHVNWHHRRASRGSIGDWLCALAGLPMPVSISTDHLARYGGILALKGTPLSLLAQALEDYFQLNIQVQMAQVRRHPLASDSLTSLSSCKSHRNTLGQGALLGKYTWLANDRLILTVSVETSHEQQQFMEDRTLHRQLREFCDLYLKCHAEVSLQLQCPARIMPLPRLSSKPTRAVQLGRHNCLRSNQQSNHHFERMIFMAISQGNTEIARAIEG